MVTGPVILSRSPEETLELGRRLAGRLRGGELVALSGPLGAGKSVLARGIGDGLGVTRWRGSPTFVLVHEYQTVPALYHLDLYRLAAAEVEELGLEEYARPDAVLVVEWPERAPDGLASLQPRVRIDVELSHLSADERGIRVEPDGVLVSRRNPS